MAVLLSPGVSFDYRSRILQVSRYAPKNLRDLVTLNQRYEISHLFSVQFLLNRENKLYALGEYKVYDSHITVKKLYALTSAITKAIIRYEDYLFKCADGPCPGE